MPAFQWFDGIISHNFVADIRNPADLVFKLLNNLPHGLCFSEQNPRMTLSMYSSLETRWVDVIGLPVQHYSWPYFDPRELMKDRYKHHIEIRDHARGWRDTRNPCGEIPLGEPMEDVLSKWASEQWTAQEILEHAG